MIGCREIRGLSWQRRQTIWAIGSYFLQPNKLSFYSIFFNYFYLSETFNSEWTDTKVGRHHHHDFASVDADTLPFGDIMLSPSLVVRFYFIHLLWTNIIIDTYNSELPSFLKKPYRIRDSGKTHMKAIELKPYQKSQ